MAGLLKRIPGADGKHETCQQATAAAAAAAAVLPPFTSYKLNRLGLGMC